MIMNKILDRCWLPVVFYKAMIIENAFVSGEKNAMKQSTKNARKAEESTLDTNLWFLFDANDDSVGP